MQLLPSRYVQQRLPAAQRVHEDQLAVVAAGKLVAGVEQFDASDRAGRVDVHEEIGGQLDRFHVPLALAQADVGDVGVVIVGQFH